jgi:hypothetical protein
MAWGKRVVSCLFILAVTTVARAESPGADLSWQGARALGRAGAGRAAADDVAGAAGNVAAVALDERYEVFAGGAIGADGTYVLRAGAVDSRTAAFTLAAGYHRRWDDVPPSADVLPGWKEPDAELSDPAVHQGGWFGVAVPLASDRVSIAATARYDHSSGALSGASSGFDVGVSVAARPIDVLTLALDGRNLVGSPVEDTTRTVGFGVRVDPGPYLGVGLDLVAPLQDDLLTAVDGWRNADAHLGLDLGLAEPVKLRGGVAWDETGWRPAAGLALVSERIDLDYGLRIDPAPEVEDVRTWHGLDVRIRF